MKIIKKIKFSYHIKMAEKAIKRNDKNNYKKHSAKIKKLIWR